MFFPEVGQIVERSGSGNGIDFYFDGTQHIVKDDGTLKELSEVESLKEWIRKVCTTVKGAFEVYTVEEKKVFGVSIYDHLGEKNSDYWKAEHEREIKTQLLEHPNIAEVKDVNVSRSMRRTEISFTVVTTGGIMLSDNIYI